MKPTDEMVDAGAEGLEDGSPSDARAVLTVALPSIVEAVREDIAQKLDDLGETPAAFLVRSFTGKGRE